METCKAMDSFIYMLVCLYYNFYICRRVIFIIPFYRFSQENPEKMLFLIPVIVPSKLNKLYIYQLCFNSLFNINEDEDIRMLGQGQRKANIHPRGLCVF